MMTKEEMGRDQFGQFVCFYWGLNSLTGRDTELFVGPVELEVREFSGVTTC